jgi:hypothetical protein
MLVVGKRDSPRPALLISGKGGDKSLFLTTSALLFVGEATNLQLNSCTASH